MEQQNPFLLVGGVVKRCWEHYVTPSHVSFTKKQESARV